MLFLTKREVSVRRFFRYELDRLAKSDMLKCILAGKFNISTLILCLNIAFFLPKIAPKTMILSYCLTL